MTRINAAGTGYRRHMEAPELLDRDVVYKGKLITVYRDTLRQGGHRVIREVVDHAGSVAIVALDEQRRVLLERQYRHPVGGFLWELPAGLLDGPDEDPLDAAKRELEEETGLSARNWERLVDLHTSPGMTGERARVFLARELREAEAGRHPDPGEELELRWVPLSEAVERVRSGAITNGLAVAGLLAVNCA
jgi:8-oxo-dGTP pyrophosphatase MutT (NUDIX family)